MTIPDAIIETEQEHRSLPRVTINFFAGVGRIVADAEFFTTHRGRPKITFRIALPRHPRLPRKKPLTSDFYSVICYGERFIPLLDHLVMGREVAVFGWAQSRDVQDHRTVNEIGAEAVVLVTDSGLLRALDGLVANVLSTLDAAERGVFRAAVEKGEWRLPEAEPWAEKAAPLFAEDGQMHPEVRLAVERVLAAEGREGGAVDGD